MKRIAFILTMSLSLIALISLQGCKETGCIDPNAINYNPDAVESSDECAYPQLSLQLMPKINGEDFQLGTVYTINGAKVKFTLFQFYVTQVGIGPVADLETPDTVFVVKADQQSYPVGIINAGTQQSLAFNLGVDSVTNHLDPTTYPAAHPLAPQNPVMHWSWDSGYIFIKIEGNVDTDDDGTVDEILELHIGKDSNLGRVMANLNKEADVEDFMISMTYDVEKFFTGIDLKTDRVTHTGDNPVLAAKVATNAPAAFTIQ